MGRTYSYPSRPSFALDEHSIMLESGRQVDWDYVNDTYMDDADVVTTSAAAAAGATELTVEALPGAIPVGTMLNFGTYAPVTVTVNDADVNATETTITVAALSGPIPSGTVLKFSGAGAGFAMLTADAAAAATTLTVEALPEDIDNAATATFAGGTIQARVTEPADAGDTTITVDELQFAVADEATATVTGTGTPKTIRAGTVMCELAADGAGARKIVPRAIRPGAETSIGLLRTDAVYGDKTEALSGYGLVVGGVVYENLLPDATGSPAVLPSAYKTELQTAGVGTGFGFRQYQDSGT